jgi:HTH-type transcriptional regulator / antitoxin HigA
MSATTPGQLVREAMEAKGWGERDLAFALGTAPGPINQILHDRRNISLGMAKALSAALGRSAEEFARAQAEYDLQRTKAADPLILARARILSRYPLRDMVKRGWIDPEHRSGTLEEQVCQFLGVRSLDEVPHLDHSAKKTDYSDIPPAQLAWFSRVRQIALEMHPAAYSDTKLREAVEAFKEMRVAPEAVRHVPRLLNEAGVRYVVAEGLPGGLIDGVCFWLSANRPVIGMSMRFDRIDNFWFVLRHECAHVLHGHGKSHVIVGEDIEANSSSPNNEEERIANSEAADFCVPAEQMRSFYLRKNPFFSESDVLAFSKRMKVHPGLTVGQLQRMAKRYDLLRKHLVRVRTTLARSMMMDGWGDVVPVGT